MEDLPPECSIEDFNKEKPLEIKEYNIKFNYDIFKIMIIKNRNSIIFKCSNFELDLTLEELSILMKEEKCNSIDISFDFFKREFDKNNVKIKKITPKSMKLIIDENRKNYQFEILSKEINTPKYDYFQEYSDEFQNQYIKQNKDSSSKIDENYPTPDINQNTSTPNLNQNMCSAPNIYIEEVNKQCKDYSLFSKNYSYQKDFLVTDYYKLSIVFDNTRKENFIMKEYKVKFIKSFPEKFYGMEILNMKRCNNKYIIKSFDDFIQDNKIILIIEKMDSTLKALFEEKKSFKIDEIKKLLIKLNEGIKHLDKNRINNIIVSPENIGIIKNEKSNTYSLKLIDLYPYYEIKENLKKMNHKSKIIKYMSPEMPFLYNTSDDLQKENDYTLNTHSKSILWNIGILIYELYF